MAGILLTHCNHLYFDRKQVRKMQPYPPLQTLLAAACLRQAGFEVAFFDATFEAPEAGFRAAVERHRPRIVLVCEDSFNFLTKMCLLRNRELAFSLCRIAREAAAVALVHSSDASDHAVEYLRAGFDFVLLGEVEAVAPEVVAALLAGDPERAGRTAGLARLDAGTRSLCFTAPRKPTQDLDSLPDPAWDLVDFDAYRAAWTGAHGYFSLNLVSSRGCPYRCNWCSKPIYGQSYHALSPARAAAQMRKLKECAGPDRLWFADDIFALSAHWTAGFAAEVEARDASIPFKMQSRCDLMTRDTVAMLRRAGCVEVWMGAESGSQGVLDAMEKGIRVEHIRQARRHLRAHGIRACFFLQFGYPGEGWREIRETIRLVRETQPDDIGVSVAYPLPGTKFYSLVGAQQKKANWTDSDDLSIMFQGAYSTDFYRALRDALHLEVELRNGREPRSSSGRLEALWRQVEVLREACASPHPTLLCACS